MDRTEDATLADELRAHHAVMIADLDRLTRQLEQAAAAGNAKAATQELERWIAEVLVPHAAEEEETTYRVAAELPEAELLIASMLAEHTLIRETAARLSEVEDPVAAGAYGRALFAIFDSHQRKENDIILPLLVDTDSVSLVEVMGDDHAHSHGHDHHHDHDHTHGHDA